MFKVNSRNTRARCEICFIPCCSVSIVNLEQVNAYWVSDHVNASPVMLMLVLVSFSYFGDRFYVLYEWDLSHHLGTSRLVMTGPFCHFWHFDFVADESKPSLTSSSVHRAFDQFQVTWCFLYPLPEHIETDQWYEIG